MKNMSLAWCKSMKGLKREEEGEKGGKKNFLKNLGGDMKKMNTTKKIAIALAVMVVTAMAAPAVMGDDEAAYTVTVLTGQDTSISAVTGAFGDVLRGTSKEITDSFTLTNSGDWNASVDAKFLNHTAGNVYGMTNATETGVIPGTAFSLDPDGSGAIALKATDTDTPIGNVTKDGGTMTCDAILAVPGSQSAEAYSGTVLLTFSNA